MRNTLVIYSSVDGHTQKISSKIAEHIKHHANVDLTSLVDAQSLSLKNYQQVIIGASIRYGNYRKELFEFIEKNFDELSSKENAFENIPSIKAKTLRINLNRDIYGTFAEIGAGQETARHFFRAGGASYGDNGIMIDDLSIVMTN